MHVHVCRFLALVCLLKDDERQGLIEYNFHCFREAIQEVGDSGIIVFVSTLYRLRTNGDPLPTDHQVFELRRKALQGPVSSQAH